MSIETDIKALIELSKTLNQQVYGEPDCKSCGLAESLETYLRQYEKAIAEEQTNDQL